MSVLDLKNRSLIKVIPVAEVIQRISISPDGRYVPSVSRATNLVPGTESNIFQQVYLRDLQTGTTTLVSATPAGGAVYGQAVTLSATISARPRTRAAIRACTRARPDTAPRSLSR